MPVAQRLESWGKVERLHASRAFAGRAWQWVSVYHVEGVLIDGGSQAGRAAFARFLAKRPIRAALATHEHEDHVASFDLLPPGTPIHAPPLTAQYLREGTPRFPLYRQAVWGYPPLRGIQAEPLGRRVEDFLVVEAKGHSMDHVAYLDEREQLLFTGDAYMGKFRAARMAEDVKTEIDALRRLAALDPAVLLPAHGPIVERPRAKLLETADHFDDLRRRALRLREEGKSVHRIARELLGPEGFLTWLSGGEFSNANMVRNLLRR